MNPWGASDNPLPHLALSMVFIHAQEHWAWGKVCESTHYHHIAYDSWIDWAFTCVIAHETGCIAQTSQYNMMRLHHMGLVVHEVIHAHRFTSGAWAQERWLSARFICLPSWMYTLSAMVHLTGNIMCRSHMEFTPLIYIISVCAAHMLECILLSTCVCFRKHR